jgi:hypothetical protein
MLPSSGSPRAGTARAARDSNTGANVSLPPGVGVNANFVRMVGRPLRHHHKNLPLPLFPRRCHRRRRRLPNTVDKSLLPAPRLVPGYPTTSNTPTTATGHPTTTPTATIVAVAGRPIRRVMDVVITPLAAAAGVASARWFVDSSCRRGAAETARRVHLSMSTSRLDDSCPDQQRTGILVTDGGGSERTFGKKSIHPLLYQHCHRRPHRVGLRDVYMMCYNGDVYGSTQADHHLECERACQNSETASNNTIILFLPMLPDYTAQNSIHRTQPLADNVNFNASIAYSIMFYFSLLILSITMINKILDQITRGPGG